MILINFKTKSKNFCLRTNGTEENDGINENVKT